MIKKCIFASVQYKYTTMSLQQDLENRSGNKCEICTSIENLLTYEVKPTSTVGGSGVDGSLLACTTCSSQIDAVEEMDVNHWRCLNDSMWSEYRAVKVVAWRMLSRLRNEGWPKDLLDMMYLEDDDLRFAKESGDHLDDSEKIIHRDANGAILEA
ncbi:MAG: protein PhnA, partial [Flavobacterium sp.]